MASRRQASSRSELIVRISKRGQITLPKRTRDGLRWTAGTRLVAEETPDGVLLKSASLFTPTRPEDVAGMLKYSGPPKTLEEMDAAITAEVRHRHARGKY